MKDSVPGPSSPAVQRSALTSEGSGGYTASPKSWYAYLLCGWDLTSGSTSLKQLEHFFSSSSMLLAAHLTQLVESMGNQTTTCSVLWTAGTTAATSPQLVPGMSCCIVPVRFSLLLCL